MVTSTVWWWWTPVTQRSCTGSTCSLRDWPGNLNLSPLLSSDNSHFLTNPPPDRTFLCGDTLWPNAYLLWTSGVKLGSRISSSSLHFLYSLHSWHWHRSQSCRKHLVKVQIFMYWIQLFISASMSTWISDYHNNTSLSFLRVVKGCMLQASVNVLPWSQPGGQASLLPFSNLFLLSSLSFTLQLLSLPPNPPHTLPNPFHSARLPSDKFTSPLASHSHSSLLADIDFRGLNFKYWVLKRLVDGVLSEINGEFC